MNEKVVNKRPERWRSPFSPDMAESDVDKILSLKPFSLMDSSQFSPSVSLKDIVRNDMRLNSYDNGDIIVRAGDYGTHMDPDLHDSKGAHEPCTCL